MVTGAVRINVEVEVHPAEPSNQHTSTEVTAHLSMLRRVHVAQTTLFGDLFGQLGQRRLRSGPVQPPGRHCGINAVTPLDEGTMSRSTPLP